MNKLKIRSKEARVNIDDVIQRFVSRPFTQSLDRLTEKLDLSSFSFYSPFVVLILSYAYVLTLFPAVVVSRNTEWNRFELDAGSGQRLHLEGHELRQLLVALTIVSFWLSIGQYN